MSQPTMRDDDWSNGRAPLLVWMYFSGTEILDILHETIHHGYEEMAFLYARMIAHVALNDGHRE